MTKTEEILRKLYGAKISIFDPISVLWANEKASLTIGVDAAKNELKQINDAREKMGIPVAMHQ